MYSWYKIGILTEDPGDAASTAAFPLIVDSSQDSTVSKEVVIVSSSVACARVVWGRYWYSNAALGPWCMLSGPYSRVLLQLARCGLRGKRRCTSALTAKCSVCILSCASDYTMCDALVLSPRVVASGAE